MSASIIVLSSTTHTVLNSLASFGAFPAAVTPAGQLAHLMLDLSPTDLLQSVAKPGEQPLESLFRLHFDRGGVRDSLASARRSEAADSILRGVAEAIQSEETASVAGRSRGKADLDDDDDLEEIVRLLEEPSRSTRYDGIVAAYFKELGASLMEQDRNLLRALVAAAVEVPVPDKVEVSWVDQSFRLRKAADLIGHSGLGDRCREPFRDLLRAFRNLKSADRAQATVLISSMESVCGSLILTGLPDLYELGFETFVAIAAEIPVPNVRSYALEKLGRFVAETGLDRSRPGISQTLRFLARGPRKGPSR